ncbi:MULTISPECIES: Gfo/Idh/MocA family protein [Subtercola]|uniref:Gfo/Idh/MocA family oxidoreductase n=1 Tax=Subtercola vilae TaxID=2056433 RepID=A0A4T2C7I3_9MICO|nr:MULTISPECIES: Gfo/Idh/MocA family oxidoreductase [Subtercola]MEA9984949.1 Gfo/Idh/MocA family oxidoreductase [Subtercola sp. RTI3]TIH40403.1 gfo/Idh/MocA family oxidoreductase [Subtercola vilae]
MTATPADRIEQAWVPGDRLPVIVVGAGAMGLEWIRMLSASAYAVPVGVVDLNLDLAASAVAAAGIDGALVATSIADVAERSGAKAVINVTVPQAHNTVNEQALRAGLPVLCEKPLAPTVAEALRQVALVNVTGGLLMVSQSRRYFNHLAAFRRGVAGLGPLAAVHAQFYHADHEPGFREQMAHPLLVDMSIHHFDMVRYLTGDEPIAVRCSSWNPAWSWFAGDAAASAEFELASGARFIYSGSRCTPGLQTSWNADWHAYGEFGAAAWNGDSVVQVDTTESSLAVGEASEGIEGSLEEFASAVRSGTTPQNEVRANVRSLAMVEAAVQSSDRGGERVVIAELLEESLARAIADELHDDVASQLQSWASAVDGIETPAWGRAPALIASGGAE